jgi:hypothetical protein
VDRKKRSSVTVPVLKEGMEEVAQLNFSFISPLYERERSASRCSQITAGTRWL